MATEKAFRGKPAVYLTAFDASFHLLSILAKIMQPAPDPPWFTPEKFSRQVFYFSLRRFGLILAPGGLDALVLEYSNSVRIVGIAVYCLQILIQRRIRPLFVESMHLLVGINRGGALSEIFDFMSQGYLCHDIYNRTLFSLAVVAELFLFMDDVDLPVPSEWLHRTWGTIYRLRLRQDLVTNGGVMQLVAMAERRYFETGIYAEVFDSVLAGTPVPHGEVSIRNNWPDDPTHLLRNLGIYPMPHAHLASHMLIQLYDRDPLLEDDNDDDDHNRRHRHRHHHHHHHRDPHQH